MNDFLPQPSPPASPPPPSEPEPPPPPPVFGIARATRHPFTLPKTASLPELALDLTVAPAPGSGGSSTDDAIVLYVLDPEPILFGAACLQAYAGAGYYASAASNVPESGFKLHIVGIGMRQWLEQTAARGTMRVYAI